LAAWRGLSSSWGLNPAGRVVATSLAVVARPGAGILASYLEVHVALGTYFSPTSMTLAKYREAIKQLKKAGAEHPAGRRYHAAMGTADAVQIFDVWDSQAQFDKFGATLVPILQGLGIEPGQPMVAEVHTVVVPPAKAPARAKAKAQAAPRRKASPKRARGRK
jgi:hypothetical protein